MHLEEFGRCVFLTNFNDYVQRFSVRFEAAIRGEGTGLEYYPIEVPALPSFRLHAVVADEIKRRGSEYYTDLHLDIGISAMENLLAGGEQVKHPIY